MTALVTLFGVVARALLRRILGVFSNPSDDPLDDLASAESDVDEIVGVLTEAVGVFVQEEAPLIYEQGVAEAGGDSLSEDSRELGVTELTDVLMSATRNMSRDAKRTLRDISRRRVEAAVAGGSIKTERKKFERELKESGITIVDSAGRRHDPESYARTRIRTLTSNLRNAGTLDGAAQIGAPGVEVVDNEGPNSCIECKQANGQRWSLAYAMANKLEHPSCVRRFKILPKSYGGELDKE